MKKRYKILLVILVIIVVIGIYILSPKYSVTNKEKNRIKKEILYNLVQDSEIEEHKIIGALAKAGLLDQYNNEKVKIGRFDVDPTITKAEFNKILKDFLG